MTDTLQAILANLEKLVAIDTQNPPRNITADGPLTDTVRAALPGFDIKVTDLGKGSVVIEARRGKSDTLFNVHLDTVPVAEGWSVDPHTLQRGGARAVGLGACDIKGAAAVLFALAQETDAPMYLVLTTDEEAGQSVCIRHVISQGTTATLAVVAEPTSATAIASHRGILSASARFSGVSGHASSGGQSAIHAAAAFIHAAVHDPSAQDLRLNIGRIEGGVKPNMIAASCDLLYGFRPLPGMDADACDASFRALAPGALFRTRFSGPALPCGSDQAKEAQLRAARHVNALGLVAGEPVSFWTEASLFAEAGIPAIVLGPGDIAQAHTADEWVSHDSLLATADCYRTIINGC